MFKAGQTNKLIQFKSLIYLIRGATNRQSSSPALPSDDRLESQLIKFFFLGMHINIFGLDFCPFSSYTRLSVLLNSYQVLKSCLTHGNLNNLFLGALDCKKYCSSYITFKKVEK